MIRLLSCILIFISISAGKPAFSQSETLEGRWEGVMADEILQVNIVQKGKKLCGYSYDFIIDNPSNSCKAYFTGSFDNRSNYWQLKGYRFIENSGSHVLMSINLRYDVERGKPVLRGYVTPKASPNESILRSDMVPVILKREYISKSELNKLTKVCFPQEDAPGVPVTKNKKPSPSTPPNKQPEARKINKEPVADSAVVVKKEDKVIESNPSAQPTELPAQVATRKRNEVSRLPVSTKSIKLKVYDNGIVDDDTVTIFYNKKLLISKQKLSEKAIEIDLELDEKDQLHEIVMYAENLGSIPPNTALIVVTAGDKRYELFSSASMEENAVLVFEYRPALK